MNIRDEDGRVRTLRTREEIAAHALEAYESLSADERKALLCILEEMEGGDDSLLSILSGEHWLTPPVTMDQFLTDPYYLGNTGKSLYPKLKKRLIELVDDGKYTEVILGGSTGWGKSFCAGLLVARSLYELSCLRDPARSFGLAAGSEIHFALISKNVEQTRKTLYQKIMEPIKLSPYFKKHFPGKHNTKSEETVFPRNVVLFLASVNAQDRILGSNLGGAAIDEADFLGHDAVASLNAAKAKKSAAGGTKADALYANVRRRIENRFTGVGKLPGRLLLISSKTTEDSFLERRVAESLSKSHVYVMEYAAWDVKPQDQFSGLKFRVLVAGGNGGLSRILGDNDKISEQFLEESGSRIIDVPVEYRAQFEDDIVGSIRDLAGLSTQPVSLLIQRQDAVEQAVTDEIEHPMDVQSWVYGEPAHFEWPKVAVQKRRRLRGGFEELFWEIKNQPEAPRHLHMDLGLKRDALGMAVAHTRRMVEVVRTGPDGKPFVEIEPEVEYDFILQVLVEPGNEIILSDMRGIVYDLIDHGYPIKTASFDTFASEEMIQQFKLRGVKADIISLDRTPDPYFGFRRALYEKRIRYYRYMPLMVELAKLEYNQAKKKVDHPASGTKDVADAVAGCFHGLTTMAVRQPLGILVDRPEEDDDDTSWVLPNPRVKVSDLPAKKRGLPFFVG